MLDRILRPDRYDVGDDGDDGDDGMVTLSEFLKARDGDQRLVYYGAPTSIE